MNSGRFVFVPELRLEKLAAYQEDVAASLRLYFSLSSPTFIKRFAGWSRGEIAAELDSRLLESDLRSAFAVLTSLEASFRLDFNLRCRRRSKDALSAYFREVEKTRGDRVRLEEDILEGWRRHAGAPAGLINQLRGAFKLRHWLAHGRYWSPKLPQKYDFAGVYVMATAIVSAFGFNF